MTSRTATPGSAGQVGAALDDLWLTAEAAFHDRVDAVESHVAGLLVGAEDSDGTAARDAAHKLAGTMGMFGMALGSDLARELEDLLESGDRSSPEDLDRMAEIVNHLRADIEARSVPKVDQRAPHAPTETRKLVGIVGRDSAFLESLVWTLEGRGFDVDHAADIDHAGTGTARPIDAVLIDADSAADPVAMIGAAMRMQAPAIVLTDSHDLTVRIQYLRAGAGTIVSPATTVDRVADVMERLAKSAARDLSVVAVGIDPSAAAGAVDDFARVGCSLEVLPRDSMLGEAIERLEPQVVIVGPNTHELDTLDVLEVIAADPGWSARHIVVLAADEAGVASLAPAALAHGAHDVVPADRGWVATAQRLRLRCARAAVDGPAGSTTSGPRARLSAAIESRLADTLASGQQLSILYFHANKLAELNQTDGYQAGDLRLAQIERILAGHFRSGDSAGRWAGAGFVAGLLADRTIGVRRLTGALDELTQAGLSCAGAIATAPNDGHTVEALIATATRRAVGRSNEANSSSGSRSKHVMVVEDDPVVAGLVCELLESEGYGVEVVRDGPAAAKALSDPDVFEVIDLVLLDITLPGLDGFGVLRAMDRANTLARVPVVVLTARVRAEEITTALDLGAVDHVAKPFSPSVLVRRVERALALARS